MEFYFKQIHLLSKMQYHCLSRIIIQIFIYVLILKIQLKGSNSKCSITFIDKKFNCIISCISLSISKSEFQFRCVWVCVWPTWLFAWYDCHAIFNQTSWVMAVQKSTFQQYKRQQFRRQMSHSAMSRHLVPLFVLHRNWAKSKWPLDYLTTHRNQENEFSMSFSFVPSPFRTFQRVIFDSDSDSNLDSNVSVYI